MSTQEPDIPYGTTAERLKAFALNDEARARISALAEQYWERAAYGMLVLFAAVLRFWNLAPRAMHHDESLHGYFSYGFTKTLREAVTFGSYDSTAGAPGAGYEHVPFMHGPFQFIGNGFMMFVFGDGDYQARMLAATLGTAMVFLPFLLRKQLGTFGALAASAFICISPTLMYYSRFTREDMYAAFWTLGLMVFIWRYLASQEDRFLYLTAVFMAGAFLTKETAFMTVAAFVLFMNYMMAMHIAERIRARSREMEAWRYAALCVGLNGVAWAIAIVWPFIEERRRRYELDEMPAAGNLLLVMATLAIPQYAATVQLVPGFGSAWRDRAGESGDLHVASAEQGLAYTSVFVLIGLSTVIGTLWRPRTWLIAAACFWVPYVLLYTTFFTNGEGFFSGIWGSMDYWISQQNERRGDQPDHYYFITISVYEFLPLILGVAGGLYYLIRGNLTRALMAGGGIVFILLLLALPNGPRIEKISIIHVYVPFLLVLLAVMTFPMSTFNRFLMFWLVVTAFGLTVAGEKMPWLNVHIALPLAVLAGRFAGEMLEGSDLRDDLPKVERLAPFVYAAIASALAVTVFVIVGWRSLASFGGWVLVAVAALTVYWALAGYSRRTALQVAAVGFVAAVSVFSLRAGVLASWGHGEGIPPANASYSGVSVTDYGDVPIEMLVYTQSSRDIPVLRDQIDAYAKESGAGKDLPIVIDSDDGFTWPWAWYLRNYRRVSYVNLKDEQNYTPPPGAPVFVAQPNTGNVVLGEGYGPGVTYHHRRWFPEDYRTGRKGGYSTRDFLRDVVSAGRIGDWLDYWIRRTPPSVLGTVDAVAYFPTDFSGVSTEPVGPTSRVEGNQLIVGGAGSAPGQLNAPSGVAVDAEGNIYVADTNNNRIQKFNAAGEYVAGAGGVGSDVRLTQPWAMAVAADGTVFVANTWAHQIVKLDSNLEQVATWGGGGEVEAGGDPMKLFGPRDITVAPDGHVLVTDTGNKRIIEYTADGEFVRQWAGKRREGEEWVALEIDEPVGIVVAPDGDIYVADFWNQRVVVYASAGPTGDGPTIEREIAIDTWGSTNVTDRPYLALLPDGRLLATDPNPCAEVAECASPDNGKVRIFAADGSPAGEFDMPKEEAQSFARPVGIAVQGSNVYVVDAQGAVVRRIPLADVVP
ncbi:MAG: flippase activity-associated protein Agl23 [Dehalococcoidia bacterium]